MKVQHEHGEASGYDCIVTDLEFKSIIIGKRYPFLKASQSTDGSMKEELKQNKQKRKDICSDECTTQNLVLDIDLKLCSYCILNYLFNVTKFIVLAAIY